MSRRREPKPVRTFRRAFNLEADEEIIDFAWAYTGSFVCSIFDSEYRGEPDAVERRDDREIRGFDRAFETIWWVLSAPLIAVFTLVFPSGELGNRSASGASKRGYLFLTTKTVAFFSTGMQGRGVLFFPLSAVNEIKFCDRFLVHEMTISLKGETVTRLFYPKHAYHQQTQTFKFFRKSSAARLIDAINAAGCSVEN